MYLLTADVSDVNMQTPFCGQGEEAAVATSGAHFNAAGFLTFHLVEAGAKVYNMLSLWPGDTL